MGSDFVFKSSLKSVIVLDCFYGVVEFDPIVSCMLVSDFFFFNDRFHSKTEKFYCIFFFIEKMLVFSI